MKRPELTDVCVCGRDFGSHEQKRPHPCAATRCPRFEARGPMRSITIELDAEEFAALVMLGRVGPNHADKASADEHARSALAWLVTCATDGVRRPGAWERGWVVQAFGEVDTEPHVDGVSWHEQPRKVRS